MNLDPAESRHRFATERVARLATVDASGAPHLVPVTFAVDGDSVYIAIDSKPKRSADLKRLRNIAENPNVALLADVYDDDWSQLWWARADGTASVITADAGADWLTPLGLLQERYPQYVADVPRGPMIRVSVTRWSGWTFTDDVKLLA